MTVGKQVHTPWCIGCETTSKHVEKLAKHFKGLDNLVFARIDASTNEHPKLQVSAMKICIIAIFYSVGYALLSKSQSLWGNRAFQLVE